MTRTELVPVETLTDTTVRIFVALGFGDEAARFLAESLVEADRDGVSSHGLMLVPMYVDRILAGSVSRYESAVVVGGIGATTVFDGRHALGQLIGAQAMDTAIASARGHGVGMAVVRQAFHFGRAGQFARRAAAAGMIGVAAANTRPMMPAVGGAEPVVGNNPLAISVPGASGFTVDMAMSEAALGKIRLAEAAGTPIPAGWAADRDGRPTTDPTEAIAGMLLPVGGAKGFGLALAIEVLTGVLSGGSSGSEVTGLYADMSIPHDGAQFFLAIDVAGVVGTENFAERLDRLTSAVLGSRRSPGAGPIRLPGTRTGSSVDCLRIDRGTLVGLAGAARKAGIPTETPMEARS